VLAQVNAERGNLLDAESGFFFAISLEPNEPTPHHWYSILLGKVGRLDAALAQARRAYELDPSSPILAANLANAYLVRNDNDQALRYAQLSDELGLSKGNHGVYAIVAMRKGRWDEARKMLLAEKELPPELRREVGPFVDAVADPAKRPAVVASMRALDPKVATQEQLLMPYMQMQQTDLVFQIIDQALAHDRLAWVKAFDLAHAWDPSQTAFRRDPRFAQLAERVGLVDYWKQYGFPDGCRAGDGSSAIVCSS
jgi:tetratricopeptide (TPR) repeat protein